MGKHVSKKIKAKKIPNHAPMEKHKISDVEKPSIDKDCILNYLNLCTNFESHITEYRQHWKVALDKYLVFYRIDTTHQPTIVASVKIDEHLNVEAFTEDGKVGKKDMKTLLNSSLALEYWFQLKKLLKHFGKQNKNENTAAEYSLIQSMRYLKNYKDASSKENNNSQLKEKLEFILGQMNALVQKKCSPDIISIACSIYLKSSSCYKYLQSSDYLILPTEQDLLKHIFDSKMITDVQNAIAKAAD